MMRILIVEDNSAKAEELESFIRSSCQPIELSSSRSYQSGLKAVRDFAPDVLLLDMTLPTFDPAPHQGEGRMRQQGGYELMRKLKLKNMRPTVILVTQFESFGEGEDEMSLAEIVARCREEFPGIYYGHVYFSLVDSGWRSKLKRILGILLDQRGDNGKDIDC